MKSILLLQLVSACCTISIREAFDKISGCKEQLCGAVESSADHELCEKSCRTEYNGNCLRECQTKDPKNIFCSKACQIKKDQGNEDNGLRDLFTSFVPHTSIFRAHFQLPLEDNAASNSSESSVNGIDNDGFGSHALLQNVISRVHEIMQRFRFNEPEILLSKPSETEEDNAVAIPNVEQIPVPRLIIIRRRIGSNDGRFPQSLLASNGQTAVEDPFNADEARQNGTRLLLCTIIMLVALMTTLFLITTLLIRTMRSRRATSARRTDVVVVRRRRDVKADQGKVESDDVTSSSPPPSYHTAVHDVQSTPGSFRDRDEDPVEMGTDRNQAIA